MLRGTSVRGLASLDERNIGRSFLLRPTEHISAEWELVYVDLSLSCMAPEGRAAMTPYVVGNHANVQSASWWLCFQCVLIGCWCQVLFRVRIRFVLVARCGPQYIRSQWLRADALHRCWFVNSAALPMEKMCRARRMPWHTPFA